MNQTLVTALVLPKLDYGNSTLAGLPVCQLNRLQSVLNAAARSIAGIRRSDHVSDAMASFHWLRVPERIRFKVAVLTFRALLRFIVRRPGIYQMICVASLTFRLVVVYGQQQLTGLTFPLLISR